MSWVRSIEHWTATTFSFPQIIELLHNFRQRRVRRLVQRIKPIEQHVHRRLARRHARLLRVRVRHALEGMCPGMEPRDANYRVIH